MSGADLLALDADTMRFVLVGSVVAAAVIYTRFGLSTAGSLTAAYVVILTLQGEVDAIAGLAVVAVVTHLVVRGLLTRRYALPAEWLFTAFVVVSALTTSALLVVFRATGPIGLPGDAELLIVVGTFVTPGLVAYDVARQGPATTARGFVAAVAGTLALTVPVLALANVVAPPGDQAVVEVAGAIPDGRYWVAVLAGVLLASAMRLQFHVRGAGFLGSVFLAEFLTLSAFVTVLAAATAAAVLTDRLGRRVILTPRQRFHAAFLLGALAAWTGLYWGTRFGWTPAIEADQYALEPLLAVGLLAADMGRSPDRAWRPVLALTITTAFVALVVASTEVDGPLGWSTAAAALLVVPALVVLPAVGRLRRSWSNAVALGRAAAAAPQSTGTRS
jgi:hypothetical protein